MTAIAKSNQISPQKYGELLLSALPKPIENEAENTRATVIVNRLMTRGEDQLTPEEHLLLKMLVLLIEEYERRTYPIPPVEPREVLLTLMENRGLKQADLTPVFGARSNVSAVLSGKRPIGKQQAKALAEFFKVSVELFI